MNELSKKTKTLLLVGFGLVLGVFWIFIAEISERTVDFFGEAKPIGATLSSKETPLIRGYVLRQSPVLSQIAPFKWSLLDFELVPGSTATLVKVAIMPNEYSEVWPRFQIEMVGDGDKIVRSFIVTESDYEHPKDSMAKEKNIINFNMRIHPGEKNINLKVIQ